MYSFSLRVIPLNKSLISKGHIYSESGTAMVEGGGWEPHVLLLLNLNMFKCSNTTSKYVLFAALEHVQVQQKTILFEGILVTLEYVQVKQTEHIF